MNKLIGLALMLCLPACATAVPPWLSLKRDFQVTACQRIKLTQVAEDGSKIPVKPMQPNREWFREPWRGRWERCNVRHVKTQCLVQSAMTWVQQASIAWGQDEVIVYRVRLGDWSCPNSVTPPPIDLSFRSYFAEYASIENPGQAQPGQPVTVMFNEIPFRMEALQ